MRSPLLLTLASVTPLIGCAAEPAEVSTTESAVSAHQYVQNRSGTAETYSLLGPMAELEATNAFFKDMGTNGRTCVSCHSAAGGWTPSASDELWKDSHGSDPLFMTTHDVGVCPDSDITKKGDPRRAMKLLIERGLTRASVAVKATAEFEVVAVDDPYACSTTSTTAFFGYRKPNPTVGIAQKTSVTWAPAPQPDMVATLKGLVVGATRLHGQTTYTPTDEEQTEGADFMLHTYFAQVVDDHAGRLDVDGARGGPVHLANQDWYPGINHASTGPTTRKVFDIYDAWSGDDRKHRALIAEGQAIFNFRQNANGGTCSGCHNSPNVGTHSVYRLFDIGVVDIADPDLPRVTLRNKTTGELRVVSNLGRAAATGLWSDVGKMKVPTLRGLSSRAPFFSSGQAKSLRDVVDHYDARFGFGYTTRERDALVAFLAAL